MGKQRQTATTKADKVDLVARCLFFSLKQRQAAVRLSALLNPPPVFRSGSIYFGFHPRVPRHTH